MVFKKKVILMIFVNLEKVFDNINRKTLFDIMKTGDIDIKNRKSLNTIYKNRKLKSKSMACASVCIVNIHFG